MHVPRVVRDGTRGRYAVAARRRAEGTARICARAAGRVGVFDPIRQAGDGTRRGVVFFFRGDEHARLPRRGTRDSRPRDRREGARGAARARARGIHRCAVGVRVLAVAAAAAVHQPRLEPRVAPRRRVRVRRRRGGDVDVRAHLRARAAAAGRERERPLARGGGRRDGRCAARTFVFLRSGLPRRAPRASRRRARPRRDFRRGAPAGERSVPQHGDVLARQ